MNLLFHIQLVVYMKKVGSLKIVTFKTDEKAFTRTAYALTFIENEKLPTKEEKVITFGKTERFPHVKSQNTCGLFKRKNRF
jgi:hypothetical protein